MYREKWVVEAVGCLTWTYLRFEREKEQWHKGYVRKGLSQSSCTISDHSYSFVETLWFVSNLIGRRSFRDSSLLVSIHAVILDLHNFHPKILWVWGLRLRFESRLSTHPQYSSRRRSTEWGSVGVSRFGPIWALFYWVSSWRSTEWVVVDSVLKRSLALERKKDKRRPSSFLFPHSILQNLFIFFFFFAFFLEKLSGKASQSKLFLTDSYFFKFQALQ